METRQIIKYHRPSRYLSVENRDTFTGFETLFLLSLLFSLQVQVNQTSFSEDVMQVDDFYVGNCSNKTPVQHPSLGPRAQQLHHEENKHEMSNHATSQPLMIDEPELKLSKRRTSNCNRERLRQKRLRAAFDVLGAVIPDYFSQREPRDRLSKIKTLRLAKKYIVALYELLERNK